MGINPIEYRAWKGVRSAQKSRLYVIANSVFRHKIRSFGVIALLGLGFLLLHAFQIIFSVIAPHESLDAQTMYDYMGSGGTFAIFAILLAAVVTSDLISDDRANSSFVLYFSRAIKVRDYLAGKTSAALLIMSLLCAIPPVMVAIASIATQTGDDYSGSAEILGRTLAAGAVGTVFFVPYGLMMSSFTKRKSYAAIGTFMSFFVMTIVAEIFAGFDPAWRVISPADMISFSFSWIFGVEMPSYVDGWAVACLMTLFVTVPAIVVYVRVKRQVVGG
ncbi:MAG TPA: ABC transporter permease subunit [Thermoplasmata archaeon]|nr:ABC transporter permease subunit [Thermoplasmata archaeon]